jgi:hypothetical protein
VATPAPGRCRQLELHRRGQVAPRSKQPRRSSRGDARAAKRVRTGGAKGPDKFLSRSADHEFTAFVVAIREAEQVLQRACT